LTRAVEVLDARKQPAGRLERARCRVLLARAQVANKPAESAPLAFAVVTEVDREYRQPKQSQEYRELLVRALRALADTAAAGKPFAEKLAQLRKGWLDDKAVLAAADEALKRLGGS
jgi:hypothetical protein